MEKQRTIKELLYLLLCSIENGKFNAGLCRTACNLWEVNVITSEELTLLRGYINTHKPSWFSSWDAYKQHKKEFTLTGQNYYWTKDVEKPRIKWLKKHIKKNS